MYLCSHCIWLELYWAIEKWNLGQPKQSYIPMVGSNEVVNRHWAGEGWASEIRRLRTWDWDGPHRICTSQTPMTQVCNTIVFIDADWKWTLPYSFICVGNNVRANPVIFLSRRLKINHMMKYNLCIYSWTQWCRNHWRWSSMCCISRLILIIFVLPTVKKHVTMLFPRNLFK